MQDTSSEEKEGGEEGRKVGRKERGGACVCSLKTIVKEETVEEGIQSWEVELVFNFLLLSLLFVDNLFEV